MKTALWYKNTVEETVQCFLCPHNCILHEGKRGICRVRVNNSGVLMSETYGKLSSLHLDPVEKKPLYHFFPGRQILSVGTVGCNLRCFFCQNYEISQCTIDDISGMVTIEPQQLADRALQIPGNIGIAFTYNEPIVNFEFMYETAVLAKQKGLYTAMVTNGFINPEPLLLLLEVIDAFSVDLKGFTETFYRQSTSSSLEPVKQALLAIRKSGKHLEIVNLVIPGLNDNPEDFGCMVTWIEGELGAETVLHLSRYFPRYKADIPATPSKTLENLSAIAFRKLKYVYVGNYDGFGNDTHCPSCGNLIIARIGYTIHKAGLDEFGKCSKCGKEITRWI